MYADDEFIRDLLDEVFRRYHYDFRAYSAASVRRRLEAAGAAAGFTRPQELRDGVERSEEFFRWLLQYLTVSTTEMFRDAEYFRALRERVIPELRSYPSLSVWVAGCSTGEEAYSLAILLAEEGLLDRTVVHATDINARSLDVARVGAYPPERLAKFSASYVLAGGKRSLSDYLIPDAPDAPGARFADTLKNAVVFSEHSLATDASFAEMHLVSCRNVLIYFRRELQDRAVALFRDSLRNGGFLGLGAKESLRLNAHGGAFDEFAGLQKIYRRKYLGSSHGF